MGFMDKAKKVAEQAQAKLDEVQKNFNESQGTQGGGAAVEYDKHGRPVNGGAGATPEPQAAAPAPGDPLGEPSPTADPAATGAAPTAEDSKAHGDPLLSDEPGSRHGAEPDRPSAPGTAPGMTSGDPLG